MQIGTDILSSALLRGGGGAAAARGVGAAAGRGAAGFGPDVLLALSAIDAAASTPASVGLLNSVYSPKRGVYRGQPADLSGLITQTKVATPSVPLQSPEQRKAEQDGLRRAAQFINAGNYAQATEIAQGILKDNPRSAGATHTLGTIALSQREYDKAEAHYRKADYLDPSRGFVADAENARTLRGSDEQVFTKARVLLSSDESYADGVRLLTNLVERSPRSVAARLALADGLFRRNNAAGGLRQYEEAIKLADGEQLATIEKRLEALREIAPNAPYVQQLIGRTQLRRGNVDEAVVSLQRATQISGRDPSYEFEEAKAHVARGNQLLAKGEVNSALAAFRTAKELDPVGIDVKKGLAAALTARGEQRYRTGAASGAVDDYRAAALELGLHGTPEQRSRLARNLFKAGEQIATARAAAGGDIDKEALAFQAAYELDPNKTTYRDKLAETRYALGDQYTADNKLKEASAAYDRAYRLVTTNTTYKNRAIEAHRTYADDRLRNLRFDDAVEAYKTAYLIDTNNLTSKQKLAAGYDARGLEHRSWDRNRKAAEDFREALQLFPEDATYRAHFDLVSAYL